MGCCKNRGNLSDCFQQTPLGAVTSQYCRESSVKWEEDTPRLPSCCDCQIRGCWQSCGFGKLRKHGSLSSP